MTLLISTLHLLLWMSTVGLKVICVGRMNADRADDSVNQHAELVALKKEGWSPITKDGAPCELQKGTDLHGSAPSFNDPKILDVGIFIKESVLIVGADPSKGTLLLTGDRASPPDQAQFIQFLSVICYH